MSAPAATPPLVVIPVLSAAESTPRLTIPIRGRSSLWRTLDSAVADLPGSTVVVTTDDAGIRASVEDYGTPAVAHARRVRDGSRRRPAARCVGTIGRIRPCGPKRAPCARSID